eukprot:CAMPEP_0206144256 /NCGR_PEP_ID=MMETSP1473-20131121/23536_1 /ASSEMBLY_ACC=CAM_ASM_001109 /TAXON_ID=1461547 /ORGANISM="Stichococcus sp, Strain RCC1054" /LENGTH=70 /DNA_ID=CAMNT_0053540027 /DNA_START=83 /DNA_END=295 /DNA_ORIENTATION=+
MSRRDDTAIARPMSMLPQMAVCGLNVPAHSHSDVVLHPALVHFSRFDVGVGADVLTLQPTLDQLPWLDVG